MQMIIHFLNVPDFLCIGPNTITPMIPLMMGLPPTAATAMGRDSYEKKGSTKYDRMMDSALNTPKYRPKASSISI